MNLTKIQLEIIENELDRYRKVLRERQRILNENGYIEDDELEELEQVNKSDYYLLNTALDTQIREEIKKLDNLGFHLS